MGSREEGLERGLLAVRTSGARKPNGSPLHQRGIYRLGRQSLRVGLQACDLQWFRPWFPWRVIPGEWQGSHRAPVLHLSLSQVSPPTVTPQVNRGPISAFYCLWLGLMPVLGSVSEARGAGGPLPTSGSQGLHSLTLDHTKGFLYPKGERVLGRQKPWMLLAEGETLERQAVGKSEG